MKRKQWEELKNASSGELHKLLQEKRSELRRLQYDRMMGKIKNVHSVTEVRRTVARLMTLLSQQAAAEAKTPSTKTK